MSKSVLRGHKKQIDELIAQYDTIRHNEKMHHCLTALSVYKYFDLMLMMGSPVFKQNFKFWASVGSRTDSINT